MIGLTDRRHVAQCTKFYSVAPNICVSSVRNLPHVTLMAQRILRWLLDLRKICGLLD